MKMRETRTRIQRVANESHQPREPARLQTFQLLGHSELKVQRQRYLLNQVDDAVGSEARIGRLHFNIVNFERLASFSTPLDDGMVSSSSLHRDGAARCSREVLLVQDLLVLGALLLLLLLLPRGNDEIANDLAQHVHVAVDVLIHGEVALEDVGRSRSSHTRCGTVQHECRNGALVKLGTGLCTMNELVEGGVTRCNCMKW